MNNLLPPSSPPLRLYGRRKGRTLTEAQQNLLAHRLPEVEIPRSVDGQVLHEQFLQHFKEVWLEIGFGNGEAFVAQAAAHRDIAFIGCEPFLNGMAHALRFLEEARRKTKDSEEVRENVRLYCGDVRQLLPILPAHCLGRIHIFYPDPWPKRRHRERRLLSPSFLQELARVLSPQGQVRCVTDKDDYAGFVLENMLSSCAFEWLAEKAQDWQKPWPDWIPTRYAQKAEARGEASSYLTFRRLDSL